VVIDTCKQILEHCEVDEFAIIAFSSDTLYFPHKRGLTTSGTPENKKAATDWLDTKVRFGGNTHLHEALALAYEEYSPLDAIFILTDGLPTAKGHTSRELQRKILAYLTKKKSEKDQPKIITIAIGFPPDANEYAEIYRFLHKICEMTDGQYLGR
jgi:hypothetical protein